MSNVTPEMALEAAQTIEQMAKGREPAFIGLMKQVQERKITPAAQHALEALAARADIAAHFAEFRKKVNDVLTFAAQKGSPPPVSPLEKFQTAWSSASTIPGKVALGKLRGKFFLWLKQSLSQGLHTLMSLVGSLEKVELTDDLLCAAQIVIAVFKAEEGPLQKVLADEFHELLKRIEHLETQVRITPYLRPKEKDKPGFLVTGYLGGGGMGVVFKGKKSIFGETGAKDDVAIKLLRCFDRDNIDAFRREAKTIAQTSGPHIVRMHTADLLPSGEPYLVTDLIPGPEGSTGAFDGDAFFETIERNESVRPMPIDARVIVSYYLALAVQETHKQGVVHRDLKPSNFLLTPEAADLFLRWDHGEINDEALVQELHLLRSNGNPIVLLTDFGLAKKFDRKQSPVDLSQSQVVELEEPDANPKFTYGKGVAIGTPLYMSPESAMGAAYQEKADLYALGLIIGQLLEGTFPYQFKNPNGAMAVMTEVATLARDQEGRESLIQIDDPELLDRLPKHMKDVIPALLANLTNLVDPEKRGSIEDVINDLRPLVEMTSEKGQEARRAEVKRRAAEQRREEAERQAAKAQAKRKTWTWIAGVAGAALLSVLAAAPFVISRNRTASRRGEFDRAHVTALQNTEDLLENQRWDEAIALLEAEMRRVRENQELNPAEKERLSRELQGRLDQADAGLRALKEANQLIDVGNRLLDSTDFVSARAAFERASGISAERREEARRGVERVNEKECQSCYRAGLRAYHRGEAAAGLEAFSRVEALRSIGLSEEEKNLFNSFTRRLNGWVEHEEALHDDAVRCLGWASTGRGDQRRLEIPEHITPDQWERDFRRLLDAAKEGDADSLSRILLQYILLKKFAESEVSHLTQQQALAALSRPEVRREISRLATARFLISENCGVLGRHTDGNPHSLQFFQMVLMDLVTCWEDGIRSLDSMNAGMPESEKNQRRLGALICAFRASSTLIPSLNQDNTSDEVGTQERIDARVRLLWRDLGSRLTEAEGRSWKDRVNAIPELHDNSFVQSVLRER